MLRIMSTPKRLKLYGVIWELGLDVVRIEQAIIGNNYLLPNGKPTGSTAYNHWKSYLSALLPFLKWHRWNELILSKYVVHRELSLLGPANSGKSGMMAALALGEWWVAPDRTTIICSTTTIKALERRIFAEINKFFIKAKKLHPWLEGSYMASLPAIVLEEAKKDGRDLRNGIIGVACFLPDTLVDTPSGKVKIQELRIGQQVINACGVGTVTELHRRVSATALKVTLSDGRVIECTGEHPFFTQQGWKKAGELKTFDSVYSANETMRLVQGRFRPGLSQQEILLCNMQRQIIEREMSCLRHRVSPMETATRKAEDGKVLLASMRGDNSSSGEASSLGRTSPVRHLQEGYVQRPSKPQVLLEGVPRASAGHAMPLLRYSLSINQRRPVQASKEILQHSMQGQRNASSTAAQRSFAYSGRIAGLETVSGISVELSSQERSEETKRISQLVQDRRGFSGHKTSGRNRRRCASNSKGETSRRTTNRDTEQAWVASVEVLESRGDERFDVSGGGYPVYNIAVSGHPSYSVNGIIVHNCKAGGEEVGLAEYAGIKNDRVRLFADEGSYMSQAFIQGAGNLDANADFKMVVSGNPNDPTDALGIIAEPHPSEGGWEGVEQSDKTRTWKNRRSGGLTIQLVGTDSPNLDYPEGQEPYSFLIGRRFLASKEENYGRDSKEFNREARGHMIVGGSRKRVISADFCRTRGATEEPIWEDVTKITKVVGLDASYSAVGGDRTPIVELWFGPDVSGKMVMWPIPVPVIVPLKNVKGYPPEDQIADFAKDYCERRGIAPDMFGFDGTGRSSLTSSLARRWSPAVNSIEFGGKPSERALGSKIPNCRDKYDRMVSELWFAVREIIDAGQMRGLTDPYIEEGSKREWDEKIGGKQSVVTKEVMKELLGKSPDIFDALVAAVEMARRKGFVILNGDAQKTVRQKMPSWIQQRRSAFQRTQQNSTLTPV